MPEDKICDDCRKKVAKYVHNRLIAVQNLTEQYHLLAKRFKLTLVSHYAWSTNTWTLLERHLSQSGSYRVKNIQKNMQKAIIGSEQTNEVEIITQLKEKYSTAGRSEKIQILTVIPKSWSVRRVEEEFGVLNFMARKAKQLVREKGILAVPYL